VLGATAAGVTSAPSVVAFVLSLEHAVAIATIATAIERKSRDWRIGNLVG